MGTSTAGARSLHAGLPLFVSRAFSTAVFARPHKQRRPRRQLASNHPRNTAPLDPRALPHVARHLHRRFVAKRLSKPVKHFLLPTHFSRPATAPPGSDSGHAHPLAVLIVALLSAAAALAAPWPKPRDRAPLTTRYGRDARARHEPGDPSPTSACATRIDQLPALLDDAIARATIEPLAVTFSRDAGNIAVLGDDGSFFYTNSGGQPLLDIAAVTRAFYHCGDDYDQLAVYLSLSGQSQWLGSPGASPPRGCFSNDTQGIGLNPYDVGAPCSAAPRGCSRCSR